MRIKIDKIFVDALIFAIDQVGGQSEMARQSGVGQSTINSIINPKKGRLFATEAVFDKLFPLIKQYMPKESLSRYGNEGTCAKQQHPDQFPQPPMMVQDFQNQDSELSLIDIPRFKPVPVISIAQAAEYEPLEPLVDYLREVSDRTQLFVDVKDNYFAVEITGDSMSPDYPDGSIALVAAGEFPERGDIVVAKFSTGQVVIKEYHRKDNVISLLSRNPNGQNFEWNKKEKPGFIQWMFPVIEIVLQPRKQRHAKNKI